MQELPLAVFAYAFPHRKTHDFLVELALSGLRDVRVIAAPWSALDTDRNAYFPHTLRNAPPRAARDICEAVGFSYLEAAHDDVEAISSFAAPLAVIAGARILKSRVINLFSQGIVNFHPGKLPETSGLDAFYRSIQKDIDVGTTAHFIDGRVDAGRELFFAETPVELQDTPEAVVHNNYQTQIGTLRRFIELWREGDLNAAAINRPSANPPMSPGEKRLTLARFPAWRAGCVARQEAPLARAG